MHILVICKCVAYEIILFATLITHYPIIANIANDAILPNFQQCYLFFPLFALMAKTLSVQTQIRQLQQ